MLKDENTDLRKIYEKVKNEKFSFIFWDSLMPIMFLCIYSNIKATFVDGRVALSWLQRSLEIEKHVTNVCKKTC